MNKDLIDITIVMDRSGSMAVCRTDAEGGLNSFIDKQKAEPGKANVTLVQFSSYVEFSYVGKDIMEVKHIGLWPNGTTALFDAIGQAIAKTGERLSAMPEDQRPGGVVFVIVTDGEENASKEYSAAKIKEMIEHQREKYNWQFTYLGANQDAFLNAASIGIAPAAVANYTVRNMDSVFLSASVNVSKMRSDINAGNAASYSYTGDQRDSMVK